MDRSMESLRRAPRFWNFALVAWLAIFFVIPAVLWVGRILATFDGVGLSSVFVWISVRSVLFTALQASLSAFVAVALAIVLGLWLSLSSGPAARSLKKWVARLGDFAFALPGVVVALLVLDIAHWIPALPSSGLASIVFAHVMVNVLMIASVVSSRASAWLRADGQQAFEAAALLGAGGWPLLKNAFGNLIQTEFTAWFGLVFLWSFSAFSTVLILGQGPGHSSPEVLLFYSLQTDADGTRVLFVAVLQLLCGALIARRIQQSHRNVELSLSPTLSEVDSDEMSSGTLFSKKRFLAGAFVLALPFALAFLWLLVAPLLRLIAVLSRGPWNSEGWLQAASYSALLAVGTGLVMAFWARGLVRVSRGLRQGMALLLGASSTFLAALWLGAGVDRVAQQHEGLQIVFCITALATAQMPLAGFLIESRLKSLPVETLEAARVLGADDSALFESVLMPWVRPTLTRVCKLAMLLALGEMSIPALLAPSIETLPLLGRRMASRYDFSGASMMILLLVGFSWLIQLWLDAGFLKLYKQRAVS